MGGGRSVQSDSSFARAEAMLPATVQAFRQALQYARPQLAPFFEMCKRLEENPEVQAFVVALGSSLEQAVERSHT